MSEQASAAVVRQWFDRLNAHDAMGLVELLDEGSVWEVGATSINGREASAEAWRAVLQGFPNLHAAITQLIVGEDYVTTRWRMTGAHQGDLSLRGAEGPLRAISPTQRQIDLPACVIHEVKHGKIVRGWIYWDTAMLLRQLGLLSIQATWI